MRAASILILLNFNGKSQLRASVSLGESARKERGGAPSLRRRGGEDEPMGWENGWGVAPGYLPNLIREGSGQEEVQGSGDGTGVDDEDLLGEFTTSAAEGLAPLSSSSSSSPVESGWTTDGQMREVKDWSKEYEYDSDNYIEFDDEGINHDTVKTLLPKFITESQLVLVAEGSEIVLPCQVDL